MSQLLIPSPTSKTRIFALIGDPVKQVKAPELLNRVFADEAVDAVMIAVHARPEQLATVIRGLQAMDNFSGMLITIAHKPWAFVPPGSHMLSEQLGCYRQFFRI